jgi:hypothetical protein
VQRREEHEPGAEDHEEHVARCKREILGASGQKLGGHPHERRDRQEGRAEHGVGAASPSPS